MQEANWDRQVGCAGQYDPAIRDALWPPLLQTDPTGAGWGPGVYRAPVKGTPNSIQTWAALAANIQAPTLLISGDYDKQAPQENVKQLYDDLQTPQKAFVGVGCCSHLLIFENRHSALFQASSEWLLHGTVKGAASGTLRLGD